MRRHRSAIMAATAVTIFLSSDQSASSQQPPTRDCQAEARVMTGSARRNFLVSCLREGGTINCVTGKKLCGISCIFRDKACTIPAIGAEPARK
jgi:hypothetical protein